MAIPLPATDKDRLDWIELYVRSRRTDGIAFKYEGGEPAGIRLLKLRYAGSPCENIREAIDQAMAAEYALKHGIQKETVKMPVLCIDCKHSKETMLIDGSGYSGKYECHHSINYSPVDGTITPKPCDNMRGLGACGPEGRLFTAKEPSVPPMPASSPPGV